MSVVDLPRRTMEDDTTSGLELLRSRILTTGQLQALPPPNWVVDHVIPADALTLLYGPSGAGKSHLGIDIASHVATDTWWNGRKVLGGRVLYIVGESPAGFSDRTHAWETHHGISVDNFHGVDWLPIPVNLYDPLQGGILRELVREREPVLVVVDTLARCAVGADENSARDMGRVIEQADLIRRAAGCAVVLIHHTGKSAENGARGSSAIRAAVDAELEVTGGDDRVTLKVTKQRNAPEILPLHFKLTPSADSVVMTPTRAGTSSELPPAAHETLEALEAVDVPGGVSTSVWKASAEKPDRTFYRHVKGLLHDGLVVNLGSDSRPLYRPKSALSMEVPLI